MNDDFTQAMAELPLVAILRGVPTAQVVDIGQALVAAGINLIEVPMNSPTPIDSIAALVNALGDSAICGAGTVLTPTQVEQVHAVGGRLIVSPNCDTKVIQHAISLDMIPLPGVATPTEAFAAICAGASFLKLFPAAGLGEVFLKNMLAVLPIEVKVLAVGGINASNMASFWHAGARGFGLGGDLYQVGDNAQAVATKARLMIAAYKQITTRKD